VTFALPARNPDAGLASMKASLFCLRVPEYEVAKNWFIDKLDFRLVIEWLGPVGVKMAYLAAADDDRCIIEVVGDGDPPTPRASTRDLLASFGNAGFHQFCFTVPSVVKTLSILRDRDVEVVAEPFEVPEIGRRIASFADPFGNLFELEEILKSDSPSLP